MWVEYNPNPMARRVIDCSIRALCRVTGLRWEEAFDEVCELARQMGNMPSANEVWGAFLRRCGWRRYALPNSCPDCYTVRHFAEDNPRGEFVVCTNGHVMAVVDGDWYDTWDSGEEIPLYYWMKE